MGEKATYTGEMRSTLKPIDVAPQHMASDAVNVSRTSAKPTSKSLSH